MPKLNERTLGASFFGQKPQRAGYVHSGITYLPWSLGADSAAMYSYVARIVATAVSALLTRKKKKSIGVSIETHETAHRVHLGERRPQAELLVSLHVLRYHRHYHGFASPVASSRKRCITCYVLLYLQLLAASC